MLFCLFAQTIFAQINFSLQLDKFGVTYTVFATPAEDMTISENVLISTAQVTLITSNGIKLAHFKDLGGEWDGGKSIVRAPKEDYMHDYISVGLVGNKHPQLMLEVGKPTALFAFESIDGCQGAIRLIDNQKDIFAQIPNSVNNNPGNDFSGIDLGKRVVQLSYQGNIEPFIVPCPREKIAPFSTNIEPQSGIYEMLILARENDVESYSIQARIKGTTDWLAAVPFNNPQLYFYGHLGQVYEYQVKTTFKDGRAEWSEIAEIIRTDIEQEEKNLKP